MNKTPPFDMQDGHKYFAAYCFNRTWDYIEKESRTAEDNEAMLQACMASLWHWSQREDAVPKNFCVGYWQASRVFALLGRADYALTYARMSLEQSGGLDSFFVAYSYEALARSEMAAGHKDKMNEYLATARTLRASVADVENKKLLEADLNTIK